MSSLAAGETVVVDGHMRDRYDRLVGKIMLAGADVNLVLVRAAYTWWYSAYAGEQSPNDRRLYEAAEKAARRDGLGLWADPRPVAPRDWRGGGKAVPAKPSSGACPCDSGRLCTGPKGGVYCVRESGSKKYFPRE